MAKELKSKLVAEAKESIVKVISLISLSACALDEEFVNSHQTLCSPIFIVLLSPFV